METLKRYWPTLTDGVSLSQAELLYNLMEEAEAIVLGIGAGMSAADGFTYVGERFTQAFSDFIAKYSFLDMLQASLFEFEDEQEYWAFQSRFSLLNYFDQPPGQAYKDLRKIISDKPYHIITTNADNAFYATGFDMNKVFRIQGEYGLLQCSDHCHQKTYSDENLMREMVAKQANMKVPADLIPHCPECGAGLEINKRNEEKGMVEDKHFQEQKNRYNQFIKERKHKKVLFLEIGVGATTPQFIKHPFQDMTEKNKKALFVTMNQKNYFIPHNIRERTVQMEEDIAETLNTIVKLNEGN